MDEAAQERTRRGRPRQSEVAERQAEMLDAATAELVERGYSRFTVSGVAERAHTSKSTVYSWFGNREGLLRAVIERYYDRSAIGLPDSLPATHDPRRVLTAMGSSMIRVLQGDVALALHRAAATDPDLGPVVIECSALRLKPVYADYFAELAGAGLLAFDDAEVAAKVFFGLCLQDDHSMALLGSAPMTPAQATTRAELAADVVLSYYGTDPH